jgi:N6-adenosine-specific RNA methylase IME4
LVGGQPLPVWITFDPLKATFSIDATDERLAGDYFFQIEITAKNIHPGWSCMLENMQLTLILDGSR